MILDLVFYMVTFLLFFLAVGAAGWLLVNAFEIVVPWLYELDAPDWLKFIGLVALLAMFFSILVMIGGGQ